MIDRRFFRFLRFIAKQGFIAFIICVVKIVLPAFDYRAELMRKTVGIAMLFVVTIHKQRIRLSIYDLRSKSTMLRGQLKPLRQLTLMILRTRRTVPIAIGRCLDCRSIGRFT